MKCKYILNPRYKLIGEKQLLDKKNYTKYSISKEEYDIISHFENEPVFLDSFMCDMQQKDYKLYRVLSNLLREDIVIEIANCGDFVIIF